MAFAAVSAGIGAASLIYGVGKSISQSHKANMIDKGNQRSAYQIPDEYKQNLAIAKQMATIGIPQQAYNNQQNAISRNQAGAVSALGNSANPGAGLSSIVRAGNDATGNLNAQDAQARLMGKRGVMAANSAIAGQKLAAQQYNQFDRYSENFNRAQALRGAANTNLNNGLNGAAQLAGGLYGMGQQGNLGFGAPQKTIGEVTGSPQLQAAGGYQSPALRTQLPTTALYGNQGGFNPRFGFNPNSTLTQPQYNNPYFPNQ